MLVFEKLDKKLASWAGDIYFNENLKPRILTLTFSLLLLSWAISFKDFDLFPYKINRIIVLFYLATFVYFLTLHIYEWRIWVGERRRGNTAGGRFFDANVPLLRKLLFFSGACFYIAENIALRELFDAERILLNHILLVFFMFQLIRGILNSAFLLELIRCALVKNKSWSNAKHYAVTACLAVFLMVITSYGLLSSNDLLNSVFFWQYFL
uniref:Uncharacterized protein n=1 Tax=uncultured microorganism TaxID=358574 RepID=K0J7A6_9ZZZZ|nr:hypothetical protein [uncultured microorganism]